MTQVCISDKFPSRLTCSALSECGYGRWHWVLALCCGWANAADAVEILCTSFLLPSAECDLQLTNVRKGTIPIVGFVGMLIGGFLWGTLGIILFIMSWMCPPN